MLGKEDYCLCCLGRLTRALRARHFCPRCEGHRDWCRAMKSKTIRWDADAGCWRTVDTVVGPDGQPFPVLRPIGERVG